MGGSRRSGSLRKKSMHRAWQSGPRRRKRSDNFADVHIECALEGEPAIGRKPYQPQQLLSAIEEDELSCAFDETPDEGDSDARDASGLVTGRQRRRHSRANRARARQNALASERRQRYYTREYCASNWVLVKAFALVKMLRSANGPQTHTALTRTRNPTKTASLHCIPEEAERKVGTIREGGEAALRDDEQQESTDNNTTTAPAERHLGLILQQNATAASEDSSDMESRPASQPECSVADRSPQGHSSRIARGMALLNPHPQSSAEDSSASDAEQPQVIINRPEKAALDRVATKQGVSELQPLSLTPSPTPSSPSPSPPPSPTLRLVNGFGLSRSPSSPGMSRSSSEAIAGPPARARSDGNQPDSASSLRHTVNATPPPDSDDARHMERGTGVITTPTSAPTPRTDSSPPITQQSQPTPRRRRSRRSPSMHRIRNISKSPSTPPRALSPLSISKNVLTAPKRLSSQHPLSARVEGILEEAPLLEDDLDGGRSTGGSDTLHSRPGSRCEAVSQRLFDHGSRPSLGLSFSAEGLADRKQSKGLEPILSRPGSAVLSARTPSPPRTLGLRPQPLPQSAVDTISELFAVEGSQHHPRAVVRQNSSSNSSCRESFDDCQIKMFSSKSNTREANFNSQSCQSLGSFSGLLKAKPTRVSSLPSIDGIPAPPSQAMSSSLAQQPLAIRHPAPRGTVNCEPEAKQSTLHFPTKPPTRHSPDGSSRPSPPSRSQSFHQRRFLCNTTPSNPASAY